MSKKLMTMHGWGEIEWSAIQRVIGDATCAWADYQGFHIGECPDEIPPYSHVWAWNDDLSRLFRVRINGDSAILGALTSDPAIHWDVPAKRSTGSIEINQYEGFPWRDDKRVRQSDFDITGTIRLFETVQLTPVTFVGLRP